MTIESPVIKSKSGSVGRFHSVPRIVEQDWHAGYFNFGKAEHEGVAYFNCGLVQRPDGLWLVTRRSEKRKGGILERIGFNSIMAFRLDANHSPAIGYGVNMKSYFMDEHFEDPRVVYHGDTTWVSCCNFIINSNRTSWTGAHQLLNACDKRWSCQRRIDPVYGNNGRTLGENKGLEKNWLWFFHNNQPHLLYSSEPHITARFLDDKFEARETYIDEEGKLPWDLGQVRGGTPPVLIDGFYWSFFHSKLPIPKPFNYRYFMGAYAFEPYPPFKMAYYTPAPLLVGSSDDEWHPGKPLVVFPCGAVMEGKEWFISLGVNDLLSAWCRIPHKALESRMVPLHPKKRTLLPTIIKSRQKLKDVTLVCVDDLKPERARTAIEQCTGKFDFGAVKFFTSHTGYSDTVKIHPILSIEEYCRFIVKELANHVETSHVLIVQWDGYMVDSSKWRDYYLKYDYIGAWWPQYGTGGNGGFSLRSKKLLKVLQDPQFKPPFWPEDQMICRDWRGTLERDFDIRFAGEDVCRTFSVEVEPYAESLGFHSFLTKLPVGVPRPTVFQHSGRYGDIIYALPTIKALGGGVLFVTPGVAHNGDGRVTLDWTARLVPLLREQEYIVNCAFTGNPVPFDYDFNQFRAGYVINQNLVHQQARICGADVDSKEPWLKVDFPVTVPGRPIAISRSSRYHNLLFPWESLVKKYGSRMVFIGSDVEHTNFVRRFGYVPKVCTENLLDVARIIAGANVFIGNQSCPMAIALGLGANVIQETWTGEKAELGDVDADWDGKPDANCVLERDNAIYCHDENLVVPKDWL